MIIGDKRTFYKTNKVNIAQFVKEILLVDDW